jgi:hypothetical protein
VSAGALLTIARAANPPSSSSIQPRQMRMFHHRSAMHAYTAGQCSPKRFVLGGLQTVVPLCWPGPQPWGAYVLSTACPAVLLRKSHANGTHRIVRPTIDWLILYFL